MLSAIKFGAFLAPLLVPSPASAIDLDVNDTSSIKDAGVLLSKGLMDYYNGNQSGEAPGMFSNPYYWWEAGVAWGALVDYSYYTGNTTYDEFTHMSLLYQSGDYWNYMTYNQTSTEGNDDQAFWGIAAMGAAEKNYTAPGKGYPDDWMYFAQATWNTMAERWEMEDCNGGLRWQIFTWNGGYNYKNLVSNGCLFHLAARLYKFTNNETFLDWGHKVWDWMEGVKFLSPLANSSDPTKRYLRALDGAATDQNCTVIAPYEWTYNQGLLISGVAYLYNKTGDDIWYYRMQELWSRAQVFFNKDGVLYEAACQGGNQCNNDQRCFKGIFLRCLGLAQKVVPETAQWWGTLIQESAKGMAQSCTGGTDGHTCGINWFANGWDGTYGLGEQICAVDMISLLLNDQRDGPYNASQCYGTNDQAVDSNGTTIEGVYGYGNAGLNTSIITAQSLNLNSGDKGGAGFLTAVVLVAMIGGCTWLAF